MVYEYESDNEKLTHLDRFRNQIDRIDDEILILLKRRFQLAKKIAKYKQENGLEIFQPEREQEVINSKVTKAVQMDLDSNFITRLFSDIMDESKKYQQDFIKNSKK